MTLYFLLNYFMVGHLLQTQIIPDFCSTHRNTKTVSHIVETNKFKVTKNKLIKKKQLPWVNSFL